MKKIITKYQVTGICKVNIKQVVKEWSHKWSISQWHEKYTLCKQNLKAGNFTITSIKVEISKKQADTLIKKLGLINITSIAFKHGSTWKKKEGE